MRPISMRIWSMGMSLPAALRGAHARMHADGKRTMGVEGGSH